MTSANRAFSGLFHDDAVAGAFATEGFIESFRSYEMALTRGLSAVGLVEPRMARAALDRIATFAPDMGAMERAIQIDGLSAPEFVRQLKAHVGDVRDAVHVGATSQDLIDTAVVLALRHVNVLASERLAELCTGLDALGQRDGRNPMSGRTRMQLALPITVGDRIATWRQPLGVHRTRLDGLRPRLEVLQLGGAVGNRNALGDRGDAVAASVAAELGLGNPPRAWHAMRDAMAEYASWLSLVTGTLGKIGQDICLMAQQGVDEVALRGGGTSSAMPHKQNPVLAELLVAFARYNAVQVSGMHHALVHEQERSGAAWALEWMILPAMAMATAKALDHALTLVASIERLGRAG